MASIYDLKTMFQNLLRPLTLSLAHRSITPNQVTLTASILSFLMGGLIALYPSSRWPFLILPLFLFLRMSLNAIDGMLAREHNMQTKLGVFLNELGDVFSDTFLYLPFALIPYVSGFLVIISVILAIITEMAGVIAIQIGSTRRYDGPMGKSDRAFALGVISLLIGLGLTSKVWTNIAFFIISILLLFTLYNRVQQAIRQ